MSVFSLMSKNLWAGVAIAAGIESFIRDLRLDGFERQQTLLEKDIILIPIYDETPSGWMEADYSPSNDDHMLRMKNKVVYMKRFDFDVVLESCYDGFYKLNLGVCKPENLLLYYVYPVEGGS